MYVDATAAIWSRRACAARGCLVTCPHMTFEPHLARMIGEVYKDGQKNICSRLENDVFMRRNR